MGIRHQNIRMASSVETLWHYPVYPVPCTLCTLCLPIPFGTICCHIMQHHNMRGIGSTASYKDFETCLGGANWLTTGLRALVGGSENHKWSENNFGKNHFGVPGDPRWTLFGPDWFGHHPSEMALSLHHWLPTAPNQAEAIS